MIPRRTFWLSATLAVLRCDDILVHAQTSQEEAICENLIQQFYLTQDYANGRNLIREHDSCDCAIVDDNDREIFLLECRLDYCPECNSLGVCGVWIFQNRYDADSLLSGNSIANDPDQALLDFSQCVDYVQGRTDRICVTSSANGETCRLAVDDHDCHSCTWDDNICSAPEADTTGGFVFDCQNLEGGIVFNSCNEDTDTAQSVALDSPFAYFDDESLQFVSCYDPTAIVITPPPTDPTSTESPVLDETTSTTKSETEQYSNSQPETSDSCGLFAIRRPMFQILSAFVVVSLQGVVWS